MDRQYGLPYLVQRDGRNVETTALALLSLAGKGEQSISEGELQELICRHPDLLPIDEIDKSRGRFEWTVQKQDGSYVPISECLAVQDAWLALIKETLAQINHAIDEA